jgi:hypothetical protein
MGTRLIAVLCVVSSGAANGTWATEEGGAPPTGETTVSLVATAARSEAAAAPWVHPSTPGDVRLRLEAGYALAVARLHESSPCRELFARLGADPFETLATGLYFPVDSYRRDVQACGRNLAASSRGAENLAYTKVGGAPTYLCRSFARISTEKAAVAVIHEALHHAGLTEWPHDRLAMSSTEITEMVEAACGF